MTAAQHPGARADCGDCHGEGYCVAPVEATAQAHICSCVSTCPFCKGTGFVAVSDAFRARRKRCLCQRLTVRIRSFNLAQIPRRHAESTRASFRPQNREQTAVLGMVTEYLNQFRPGAENRGLVLYGPVGRGKTHLLVGLLRELVFRHGATVRFVEFSHLLADLKSGFDVGRGTGSTLDPLLRVDVLAIDELGKGRNTEFEGTVVDELVSRRYNSARAILATSNYEPGPATGRAAPNMARPDARVALADRIGDRVYSRLRETCDFVPVRGEDYREGPGRQRRSRR